MPRPRTHTEAARTQAITVRVTPAQHARLSAEAAQIGTSVSGLAERYITKGAVRIEASQALAPLHPALIAELKRIGGALTEIAHSGNAAASQQQAAQLLRDFLQILIKDEVLAPRVTAIKNRTTANDSAPASPRDQFQRVVHLHPARSERQDP